MLGIEREPGPLDSSDPRNPRDPLHQEQSLCARREGMGNWLVNSLRHDPRSVAAASWTVLSEADLWDFLDAWDRAQTRPSRFQRSQESQRSAAPRAVPLY